MRVVGVLFGASRRQDRNVDNKEAEGAEAEVVVTREHEHREVTAAWIRQASLMVARYHLVESLRVDKHAIQCIYSR